jgi:hypothetical protein
MFQFAAHSRSVMASDSRQIPGAKWLAKRPRFRRGWLKCLGVVSCGEAIGTLACLPVTNAWGANENDCYCLVSSPSR